MKLYSVKDIVADEFGPVFEAKNHAVANRAYRRLLLDNVANASDYELHCIADFDSEKGVIIVNDHSSFVDNNVAEVIENV